MDSIKVIIIDADISSGKNLLLRLKHFTQVKVVAQCQNETQALALLKEGAVDVVFLDVESISVKTAETLKKEQHSLITVIVSAGKRYAVDAYDINALDYLIKPVKILRLKKSIERIKEQIERTFFQKTTRLLTDTNKELTPCGKPLTSTMAGNESQSIYVDKIVIKNPGKVTHLVSCDTVEWIDAAGDYMCVHAEGDTHILRSTMKELVELLNPDMFQRIHRSTVINKNAITDVFPHVNGECFVKLTSGIRLKVSRGYRKKVKHVLSNVSKLSYSQSSLER